MSAVDTDLVIPALRPVYRSLTDVADAGLRIAAGLFLMPHGAQKLFGFFGGQLGFGNGYLAALGAGSVELIGGLLLALGLGTRTAAAAIVVLLATASTVHMPNGFFWTEGGWEYPVLWAIVALAYVVKGGGAYSLDRALGREI